ncbi:MAG: hypothetical protein N3B16_11630 [Candidatus Aminicenantes bacterium]|nr:hypothetical protein [Candidatus Aminicenantes bacterium]
MKAKEFVWLILLIFFGTVISLHYSGRFNFLELSFDEFFKGEPFTFKEVKIIEPPLSRWLVILNPQGEVIVNRGDTDKIEIYWEKTIWAENEDKARRKAEKITLFTNKADSADTIKVESTEKEKINYQSNLRITVPLSLAVKVDNSHGLVSLKGLKEAVVNNTHGPIKVSQLSGNLFIKSRHGDITLEQLGGKTEIFCEHGQLAIFKAQGEVKIEARHGNLDMEEIASGVEIKAKHLTIRGRKIKGPSFISSSYEPIDLKEIGEANIENSYGLIRIQEAQGNLIIKNRYASVDIVFLEGNLSISGKNSRVRGESIKGEKININASYDNVELKGFYSETSISLRHGNCIVEPISLKSGFNFDGHYASLRLLWPEGETPTTEIKVRNGKILWHLEEPVNQFESDGETVLRAFIDGKINPLVSIKNSYGQIIVETLGKKQKSIFP